MSVTSPATDTYQVRPELGDYEDLLSQSPKLQKDLEQRIQNWQQETAESLQSDNPYADDKTRLDAWHNQLQQAPVGRPELNQAADQMQTFCKKADSRYQTEFWQRQIAAADSPDDYRVTGQHLADVWQKTLDKAEHRWQMQQIKQKREQFLQQVKGQLDLLQSLQSIAEGLDMDPGLFMDLSKGNLSPGEIAQFKRWAEYIANNQSVKDLCELLGKMRGVEQSVRLQRVKTSRMVPGHVPDVNSREEIVGIRLGRDLEHVLPSEKALLSDPDSALLFDLKFVESRLMCFDMQGLQNRPEQIEIEKPISEDDKLGPMILCIDTSGSMSGAPETIAKAVALYFTARARKQDRACYLINFSTGIETLDLSGEIGMEQVIRFLQLSFNGGTDAVPALEHGLEMMQQEDYEKADLLMISDFVMSGLPQNIMQKIDQQRVQGNQFNSLVIDSGYSARQTSTQFDNEWIYDPATQSVRELVNTQLEMTEPQYVL